MAEGEWREGRIQENASVRNGREKRWEGIENERSEGKGKKRVGSRSGRSGGRRRVSGRTGFGMRGGERMEVVRIFWEKLSKRIKITSKYIIRNKRYCLPLSISLSINTLNLLEKNR